MRILFTIFLVRRGDVSVVCLEVEVDVLGFVDARVG